MISEQRRGEHGVQNAVHRRLPFPPHVSILYLHQFFVTREGAGGTRSYEFARRFVERGHGVRMVTAGEPAVDGIEVVGVRGAYSDYMRATGMSNLGRMGAFARFAAGATVAALRGPRPDVIYATSPPLTMALPALRGLAAVAGAARVRGARPVAGGADPDGRAPQPARARLARALERFVYARSTRLIALSPGIQAALPRRQDGRWCRMRPTSTCSIPNQPAAPSRSPTSAPWARRTTSPPSWRPRDSSRTCASC